MIKLLLADDHQIILDGLKRIFEDRDDIEVVGLAHNGNEVLSFLTTHVVDVVCMDLEMPGMDGLETTRVLTEKYPHIRIVILSMYDQPEMIRQLAMVGINGYVKKDAGKHELLLAIEKAGKGQTYFSHHFTKSLIQAQQVEKNAIKLTSREKEVLRLLHKGYTTKDIAERLFISPHTVESHRKNLLSKFEVNNTPALINQAVSLKLLNVT